MRPSQTIVRDPSQCRLTYSTPLASTPLSCACATVPSTRRAHCHTGAWTQTTLAHLNTTGGLTDKLVTHTKLHTHTVSSKAVHRAHPEQRPTTQLPLIASGSPCILLCIWLQLPCQHTMSCSHRHAMTFAMTCFGAYCIMSAQGLTATAIAAAALLQSYYQTCNAIPCIIKALYSEQHGHTGQLQHKMQHCVQQPNSLYRCLYSLHPSIAPVAHVQLLQPSCHTRSTHHRVQDSHSHP